MYENRMKQTIQRFRPSLVHLNTDLLEVVVRDATTRYEANTDKWEYLADFVGNYLSQVESLMAWHSPDNATSREMFTHWAMFLKMLNQGEM